MDYKTYIKSLDDDNKLYVKIKRRKSSHWFFSKKPSKFEGQIALIVGGTKKGTNSKIRLELVNGKRFSTSYRNVELLNQLELFDGLEENLNVIMKENFERWDNEKQ
jgi:hypothetical protein